MTWLFYFLSIVVTAFYFLLDGHKIKESVIRTFPSRYYIHLSLLATDIDLTVQAFFRGQIVLGLLFGAVMFAVYSVLGIHYALLLCVVLAFWEVVPVIGPTIGFLPTVVAVALDGVDLLPWNRLWQLLFVVIIFNLFQWMKDNFVAPRYIGNVIGLHPVMIFIAIMVGARLDGMAGVICSLPAACVINVLITHQTTRTHARNRNTASLFKNAAANAAAAALVGELEPSIKPSTTC
jgi:predicted PurR-regulated permease PerM